MKEFQDYLNNQFRDWQILQLQAGNKRPSLATFAEELGVKQSTLSTWMNGKRKPSLEGIIRLANCFGPEIYDVLGMEEPDPELSYLQQIWPHLSEKEQHAIKEQAEKYYQSQKGELNAQPKISQANS